MPTPNDTLKFVRLDDAARIMGAASVTRFVADLRSLTPQEKREVADLVKKGG
jgi:hypothetical protein